MLLSRLGNSGTLGWRVGPVSGELCPAGDPAFEDLLFGSGQWLTEFRWWHAEIVVGAVNPLQQLAFGGLTGHDGRISGFQFCGG